MVSKSVKIIRLHKVLAALGILIFFTFGAFAVSLAHDSPFAGPLHTFELRHVLKNGPAQLDEYTLTVGFNNETGEVPNSAQPDLEERRITYSHGVAPERAATSAQVHAAKVSLQILESVLLL